MKFGIYSSWKREILIQVGDIFVEDVFSFCINYFAIFLCIDSINWLEPCIIFFATIDASILGQSFWKDLIFC